MALRIFLSPYFCFLSTTSTDFCDPDSCSSSFISSANLSGSKCLRFTPITWLVKAQTFTNTSSSKGLTLTFCSTKSNSQPGMVAPLSPNSLRIAETLTVFPSVKGLMSTRKFLTSLSYSESTNFLQSLLTRVKPSMPQGLHIIFIGKPSYF